jgi:hypothetical protein
VAPSLYQVPTRKTMQWGTGGFLAFLSGYFGFFFISSVPVHITTRKGNKMDFIGEQEAIGNGKTEVHEHMPILRHQLDQFIVLLFHNFWVLLDYVN